MTTPGGTKWKPLTPAQELRAAQREAWTVWLAARKRAGVTRFTDAPVRRWIAQAVERVYAEVRWCDVIAALERHAADPFSKSPWYLDAWARMARADREDLEATEARMRDRDTRLHPSVASLVVGVRLGMTR